MRAPSPRATVLLAGFLLGTSQGLGEVVRDCSLTCNVGARHAPFAFLAAALISLPFLALQLRWQQRLGFTRWQVGTTLLAASSLVAFRAATWALLETPAARWAYVGFYLWVDVVFAGLAANLLSLVRRVYGGRTEAGLQATATALAVGALVGSGVAGIAGPWLASWVGGRFEVARDHMMLGMAAPLLLLIPVIVAAERASSAPERAPARVASPLGMLRAEPGALLVALIFAVTGVATVLLDALFYQVVGEQGTRGTDGFVSLFARINVFLNALALLYGVFGPDWPLRRLGVVGSLLALPLLLLLGTTGLLVYRTLAVMLLVRVIQEALGKTVYDQATERLVLELGEDRYDEWRTVFERGAARVGMAAAAVTLLTLTFAIPAGSTGKGVLVVGVLLLWLGVIGSLAWRTTRADQRA